MHFLLVPKPLFTSGMIVEGYYLSYQYGNAILESVKSNPLDRAMTSPFFEFINKVGLDALTQDKPLFVPITEILLMTDMEKEIKEQPSKIVFIMDKRTKPEPAVLERMKRFNKLGYRFAVIYQNNLEENRPYVPYTDYLFLRLPVSHLVSHARIVQKEFPRATVVATDIEEQPIFDMIKHSSIDLFDGPFYKVHIPSSAKQNALTPLKVNYIQLLNIVNQEDFDFQTFTRTVRQDMALAVQFMKLVNTASASRTEIKNLNQAAAMLGQREIRKWVAAAVTNALCADNPSEITRISLLRAKFCENMGKHFEMAIANENLFLMGLFSVLDVVLSVPIKDALGMVFVPSAIFEALVDKRGSHYEVLHFILTYEQGAWAEISRIALMRHITVDDIHIAYRDALLWYSNMINLVVDTDNI
ncbi:MAG: HDOD domain-containing protein [Defluviitaleaceae bacterium]|nr:HDOD domain-containing protein [Defluviitaleaceae bacterium]